MKLCVVGNGPSAEGHGTEIDDCDFVVRMKAWWAHGAENAGERCDAWVLYGWDDAPFRPEYSGECWVSQTISQLRTNPAGWDRSSFVTNVAQLGVIRWVPDILWDAAFLTLGRHPSTGFIAVCLAMAIKQPAELVLYGFDSTTVDKPNYDCARRIWPANDAHHFDKEKLAMAEIRDGVWLGQPTKTKLQWIGEPEHDIERDVCNPSPLRIDSAAGEAPD